MKQNVYEKETQECPETGRILEEKRKKNGMLHCDGKPAVMRWDDETGELVYAAYFRNNELHRRGYAAQWERDPTSGEIISETWSEFGVLHREDDAPAFWTRDPLTGVVTEEQYLVGGVLHREMGPAFIQRESSTGKELIRSFFRDGDELGGTPGHENTLELN